MNKFFASSRLRVSFLLLWALPALAQLRSPTENALASAASLRNGLVSYWACEEGAGTTIADWSGNGYTATTSNSPVWGAGMIGNGMNFAGTNTRAALSASTTNVFNFETTGKFSVAAWIKCDALSNGYVTLFAGSTASSAERGMFMSISDQRVSGFTNCVRSAGFSGTPGQYVWNITAQNVFVTTNWTHVCLVFDRGEGTNRTWVNGVSASSYLVNTNGPLSTMGSSRVLGLGRASYSTDLGQGVEMDEVAVYSRPLSPHEISRLFNYGRGSRWPFTVSPPVYGN